MCSAKPAVLRSLCAQLIGDASVPMHECQKSVDERLQFVLASDDPDLVWDLCELNNGRPQQYDHFWKECQCYIDETAAAAVDERQHDNLLHLATAMSANDLYSRVCERLPSDTKKPSVKWFLLQFGPRMPPVLLLEGPLAS